MRASLRPVRRRPAGLREKLACDNRATLIIAHAWRIGLSEISKGGC